MGFEPPTFWLLEAARLAWHIIWHTTTVFILQLECHGHHSLSLSLPVCIHLLWCCMSCMPFSLCVCLTLSPSPCIFAKLQGQAPICRNFWPPMPGTPLWLSLPVCLCLSLSDCTCTKLPHHSHPLLLLCVTTVHIAHMPPMPASQVWQNQTDLVSHAIDAYHSYMHTASHMPHTTVSWGP